MPGLEQTADLVGSELGAPSVSSTCFSLTTANPPGRGQNLPGLKNFFKKLPVDDLIDSILICIGLSWGNPAFCFVPHSWQLQREDDMFRN